MESEFRLGVEVDRAIEQIDITAPLPRNDHPPKDSIELIRAESEAHSGRSTSRNMISGAGVADSRTTLLTACNGFAGGDRQRGPLCYLHHAQHRCRQRSPARRGQGNSAGLQVSRNRGNEPAVRMVVPVTAIGSQSAVHSWLCTSLLIWPLYSSVSPRHRMCQPNARQVGFRWHPQRVMARWMSRDG